MPPRTLLILRPDTMGDLVLFAPTLQAVCREWSRTRVVVLVRHAYLDLARQLEPRVDWLTTSLDPFAQGPEPGGEARAWRSEFDRLAAAVVALQPDLVVAACPRRTWLDAALMAVAPRARHVAFASTEEDPYFGVQARRELGADGSALAIETAAAGPGEQDWQRNFGLADHLLGRAVETRAPAFHPDAAASSAAEAALAERGLRPKHYLACCPAGFANVRIKTWPADRFAAVLNAIRSRGMPALLLGAHAERDYLEAIAGACGAQVWTGGQGELSLLAALLERGQAFLGNDTGAMHLAAAVGVPVVGVFGGGTWPRFVPAARSGAAVVHPLPCFGCGWDCPFGDAPCVRAVSAQAVEESVEAAMQNPEAPFAVKELTLLSEPLMEFMGHTAAIARGRAAAHLAREQKLQEIAFLAAEKDGEIGSLKGETDAKDREIGELKAAADEKDRKIVTSDAEMKSKDREIRALKAAADAKDVEIAALAREHKARDAIIAGLEQACAERLALINELDRQLKQRPA